MKIITFEDFNLNEIVRIGKNSIKVSENPIEYHTHDDCYEIIYHYTGEQYYYINYEEYKICGGQILIIRPYEIHGTGKYFSQRKIYYNIIFRISSNDTDFLGMTKQELQKLKILLNCKQRIFNVDNSLKTIFNDIMTFEVNDKKLNSVFYRSSILKLFYKIYLECTSEKNKVPDYIVELASYIDKNPNCEIDFEKFARSKSISLRKLKELFILHKGFSPFDYMNRARINHAEELLRNTNLSITDIAYELCFSSSQHFATVYKKYMNRTPSQYRNSFTCKNNKKTDQYLDLHMLNSKMQ